MTKQGKVTERSEADMDTMHLIINDEVSIKGKMSVTRSLDVSKTPNEILITGQLLTHWYFDEIKSIESERYTLKNVLVIQEAFGSDDFNIVYTFVAEELIIKGNESPYSDEEIELKEAELYKNNSEGNTGETYEIKTDPLKEEEEDPAT